MIFHIKSVESTPKKRKLYGFSHKIRHLGPQKRKLYDFSHKIRHLGSS